jgi:hypothetical protein
MTSPPPPVGWYPATDDLATMRYWDGAAWTGHTAPVGSVEPAIRSAASAERPPLGTAPDEKPVRILVSSHGPDEQQRGFPARPVGFGLAAAIIVGALLVNHARDSGDPLASVFDGATSTDGDGGIWGASDSEACDLAADEAIRISGEQQNAFVQLLKVRSVHMVKDNRDSFETPTGTGEEIVIKCQGTGVWSDGDRTTEVIIRVSADADEDTWIYYEPVT